jgi:hypothetical protein
MAGQNDKQQNKAVLRHISTSFLMRRRTSGRTFLLGYEEMRYS